MVTLNNKREFSTLYFVTIIANNIMFDELQNAVKKLDQLCKSTQIVRDYVTTGEDIIDKVRYL